MRERSIHAGDHIGDFLLLERISHDPLCEAWKARARAGNRVVTLRLPYDDRTADQFVGLRGQPPAPQNRHLLRTLRLADDNGVPFIVQEYADGASLRELLSRQGRLPANRAKHLFVQILQGLDALHQQGQTHGNLKPDKVIVTRWDAVKLADVGTGRVCGQIATERLREAARNGLRGNGLLSIVAYQSPEQRRGEACRPAGDVYAAGMLLYEMLAGRPLGGELAAAELAELPDWAADILPKCLDRQELRCDSASAVLEALTPRPRQRQRDRPEDARLEKASRKTERRPGQRGRLAAGHRHSARKIAAWITILSAVLIPAICLLAWLWLLSGKPVVTGLQSEDNPQRSAGPLGLLWQPVKSDCEWAWADVLHGGGQDVLPGRENRFVLIRLAKPADAEGAAGLVLRGDGSKASLTDSEGNNYPCRGYVGENGLHAAESGSSLAVPVEADGWLTLAFELPTNTRDLRLRLHGFGRTLDVPLTASR